MSNIIINAVDFEEARQQFIPSQPDKMEEEFVVNYQDAMDFNGDNLIHVAIKKKWSEMILILIKKKAGLNSRDEDNLTPLDLAYKKRDRQLVNLLKTGGATKFRRVNILHYLCFEGNVEQVIEKLHDGWDANTYDDQNNEPLAWARDKFIAQELISRRGDLFSRDKKRNTILHWLVRENSLTPERRLELIDLLEYLVRRGVNPQAKNKDKMTAIDLCVDGQVKEFLASTNQKKKIKRSEKNCH